MEVMIGIIIGIIFAGIIAILMFSKELEKIIQRHEALQAASLREHDIKMMEKAEKYFLRSCKKALKRENPKLFLQLKKHKK